MKRIFETDTSNKLMSLVVCIREKVGERLGRQKGNPLCDAADVAAVAEPRDTHDDMGCLVLNLTWEAAPSRPPALASPLALALAQPRASAAASRWDAVRWHVGWGVTNHHALLSKWWDAADALIQKKHGRPVKYDA